MKVKKLADRYWCVSFEFHEPFLVRFGHRKNLHPAVRRAFIRASLLSCISEGDRLNCYVQFTDARQSEAEMLRFERIVTLAQIVGLPAFVEEPQWD